MELEFDDVLERCAIARQLALEEGDAARETLLLLARDPDALVRTEAYDSLGSFPGIRAFLEEAIRREPDELARFYAILSWSDVTEGGSDFLEAIARKERSPYCRVGIACARYARGQERGLEELLALLPHRNYHIRCCVLKSLIEILNPGNRDSILRAAGDLARTEKVPCVLELLQELREAAP